MENYIVINGKKADLTPEQLKQLGIAVPPPKVLGDYTMDDILKIIRSGKASEKLKLHDVIEFAGYELEIIGINHDRPEFTERGGSPTITVMATCVVANRRMHPGNCKDGWINTELREWLNEEFYESLPEELKEIISSAYRSTCDNSGHTSIINDYLFLPSESELFGSAIFSSCMAGTMKRWEREGEKYSAFRTSRDRMRQRKGEWWGDPYWTSSVVDCSSSEFVIVGSKGEIDCAWASEFRGVPLCFQIE